MSRYRKKPVEIEAVQWDGTADGATPIIDWALRNGGSAVYSCTSWAGPGEKITDCEGADHVISIDTLEGDMAASPGDWIIRGIAGEFYPCKPDIFEATYELVEE